MWFGEREEHYGAECSESDVAALLARALPRLRALRLMNADFTDEVVPLVIASPIAGQLEVLDFSLGTLSDTGAGALAAARTAFPRLTGLRVYDCALTSRGLARLHDAGFPVDETPGTPAEAQCLAWRHESPASYQRWQPGTRSQKTHRFVSVSE